MYKSRLGLIRQKGKEADLYCCLGCKKAWLTPKPEHLETCPHASKHQEEIQKLLEEPSTSEEGEAGPTVQDREVAKQLLAKDKEIEKLKRRVAQQDEAIENDEKERGELRDLLEAFFPNMYVSEIKEYAKHVKECEAKTYLELLEEVGTLGLGKGKVREEIEEVVEEEEVEGESLENEPNLTLTLPNDPPAAPEAVQPEESEEANDSINVEERMKRLQKELEWYEAAKAPRAALAAAKPKAPSLAPSKKVITLEDNEEFIRQKMSQAQKRETAVENSYNRPLEQPQPPAAPPASGGLRLLTNTKVKPPYKIVGRC
jgi:hypothetical protein